MFSRQSRRIQVLSSIFAILFICVLPAFAEVLTVPQQVRDWQTAAAEFEKSGDFTGAHATYEKIVQGYPKTAYGFDACAKNAGLYAKQKQFDNLLPVVDQICIDFPDQPNTFPALYDLIEKCMYDKAFPTAESICKQVQSRFSSDPRAVKAIGWQGMVAACQGNLEEAGQMRQALLQKKDCAASDFMTGMCNIGLGYYNAGELDESLATYRLGLGRDPNHSQAVYLQYQIAKTMLAKDDVEGTGQEMQTLLAKYGHQANTPGLAFRLGDEYYKKWNLQGAINVYEKLLAQYGDHELAPKIRGREIHAYETIAKGYRREKQTDRAIATYETVLERFPDEQLPFIQDAIVETYAEAGDLVRSQQALQTDIQKYPRRPELLRVITRVAVDTARAGDPNTAEILAETIFGQNPEGADQQLFGYTTRARVYVYLDKDAEAMAIVDEAIKQFKDHPDSLLYHLLGVGEEYYFLAQKAKEENQLDSANQFYQKAIRLWQHLLAELPGFNNPNIMYFLGLSHQDTGQLSDAINYYQQVVVQWPQFSRRCNAMHRILISYDEMINAGEISEETGKSNIREICQLLMTEYPTTTEAQQAQCWLDENAGN